MNWAQWWTEHAEAAITLLIGGLLGGLANWFFYWRAEKPKRLGWERISGNRIISASEDQGKHLAVTYRNREVKNPYVLVLRIANVGKQEIKAADFTQPISFDFGKTELLAFEVTGRSNSKIRGEFAFGSKRTLIYFHPDLLNRDEWLELQFVTDGDPGLPSIDTRFAGQSAPITDMQEKRRRRDRRVHQMSVFLPRITLVIVGGLTLLSLSNPEIVGQLAYPISILLVATFVVAFLRTFYTPIKRLTRRLRATASVHDGKRR